MKVLVVDAGGRGNAIAHAFSRSEKVKEVYVAPGNAGSEFFPKCKHVSDVPSIRAIEDIVRFAKNVDIVYIGPEEPLSLGLVDRLEEEGIPAVGPRKEETILEASKCWCKDFLNEIGVPIPEYRNFDDPDEAKDYVKEMFEMGKKVVVKADGLAAGKGVFVCDSLDQAMFAIDEIMVRKRFGESGKRIVVEERLYGVEVAFTAICDGKTVKPFGHVKDYKRAFDPEDIDGMRDFYIGFFKKFITRAEAERLYSEGKLLNPNTGGMGAVSPHPNLDKDMEEEIMEKVVKPIVKNFHFKGVLYPVLMITDEPKVLEVNVRECDPGAQAKLPRLESDMADIAWAIVNKELENVEVKFSKDYCVAICAVSGALKGREGFKPGYPSDHYTSQPIEGLEDLLNKEIVYANGIAKSNGYVTTGGRVLTVVGRGKSLEEAREKAYRAISHIRFPGMRYRKTIAMEP